MEGHVRKRGSKWYYSFEASSVDGKRKRIERVGGRTKKEAEVALRVALQEYNNAGLHFEPSEMSVSDYMDYWFNNYVMVNCRYNTQQNYMGIIENHIKPSLGIYKVKSLSPAILQEFVTKKTFSGLGKSQVTNIMTVLSGSLKYAVHPAGFIKENPMQYVTHPKLEYTRHETNEKVLTDEEFDLIMDKFPTGTTYHIMIMIGYHTGCRIGEVTGLTWDDVDLEKGTIDVNKICNKRKPNWYFDPTKTKESNRTIRIGKTLIAALKQQKKWQAENRLKYGQHYIQQYEIAENKTLRRIISLPISLDPGKGKPVHMVCTQESGKMATKETFLYASRIINYGLGIQFNFHALRHTHATTLIENGANMKDVQKRLGHTRLSTTMDTYTHVTEKMENDTVEIFEKQLCQREKSTVGMSLALPTETKKALGIKTEGYNYIPAGNRHTE